MDDMNGLNQSRLGRYVVYVAKSVVVVLLIVIGCNGYGGYSDLAAQAIPSTLLKNLPNLPMLNVIAPSGIDLDSSLVELEGAIDIGDVSEMTWANEQGVWKPVQLDLCTGHFSTSGSDVIKISQTEMVTGPDHNFDSHDNWPTLLSYFIGHTQFTDYSIRLSPQEPISPSLCYNNS